MASLKTFMDLLPKRQTNRYSNAQFVAWGNELLEEIQERGFVPQLNKEAGVLVKNYVWIDKPADLLFPHRIRNANDSKHVFSFKDVNDKLKLTDAKFPIEDTDEQIESSAFGSFYPESITCTDLTDSDYEEDCFKNYLFLITEGTYKGIGYIVSGNDASTDQGGTKIDFLHELSAALDNTKVTAARLVRPCYYAMLEYRATVTEVSAITDEFPIGDDCEKRLVPAWLNYCCERQASAISKETQYWENKAYETLYSMQSARNSVRGPAKGRRLIGFENLGRITRKQHPDYPGA